MIFLTCLVSNVFMFGVICFVQWVHYPMFAKFKIHPWVEFHAFHSARTSFVVAGPMVLQLTSTIYLLVARDVPSLMMSAPERIGLAISTLLSVGVTALVSMPIHNRLAKSYGIEDSKSLIRTNYLRVMGWGGASLILMNLARKGFSIL